MTKFFSEIFQDVDGGFSAKRAAFFVFIGLFSSIVIGVVFFHAQCPQVYFDSLVSLIKWVGGFILLEHVPAVVSAARGMVSKAPQ